MNPLWSNEVEERVRSEAKNLDPQTRPKEVKYCRACVISNQRPRIIFDNTGLCSACLYSEYKNNGIPWEIRHDKLVSLLSKHRRKTGYDVVVPCSGGKDSSYVAHVLKHKYGMHPLCVKFAPFMYTDIGRTNWEKFQQSGFDCMEFFPDGLTHRKLARLCFEYLGDPFQPFVYGQLALPMKVAKYFGISLVMYGENGEAEYGGDPGANDRPRWDTSHWERIYTKGAGVDKIWEIGKSLGALEGEPSEAYTLPSDVSSTVEFHWLGYYLKWHPQSNYYHAAKHTGFEANPDGRSEGTYSKYASLDDKLDGLHYYMAYIKFGIGRCTSDAAHEIRDGEITRDEGVALVRRYDGEFPVKHLDECLEYLGITNDHLKTIVDRFRPEHIWEDLDEDGWRLKNGVWRAQEKTDSSPRHKISASSQDCAS